METNPEIARAMLENFLGIWTVEKIQAMPLKDYVGVKRPETFTQYVEHRTRPLGSISGKDSSKFGIWERRNPARMLEVYTNNGKYSWPRKFPFTNPEEAFDAIKAEVLSIIEAARHGDFSAIDRKGYLLDIFKWKVAYLYSGERLVSIFSQTVLQRIAASYGLTGRRGKVPTSHIQQAMMDRKPYDMTIYEYSNQVFQQFAKRKEKAGRDAGGAGDSRKRSQRSKRINRKAATNKDEAPFMRRGSEDTFVTQEHNRLQRLLRNQLIAKYGKDIVLMEHNYVDLKVTIPEGNILYEVKAAGYASACVEQALGQILRYAFNHADGKEDAIRLVIAGKYRPNESDAAYIRFVCQQLTIPLEYISIEQS